MIRRAVNFFDERTGQVGMVRKLLRYVFPDHWSFLFGEIALYSFLILVGTGVYLTLFFEPSLAETTYQGSYDPLVGTEISRAYASALDLSFEIPGGLLIRQAHHWAALLFVAAIAIHLMRIFFTGAFRKPRELNYVVGLSLLTLALLEGFAGYSLLDDLLSGMGLAIANGVSLSIPVIGGDLSTLVWGGEFPGADAFLSRLYIVHVLIIPVIIGGLIAVHLLMIMLPHHAQFRGKRKREGNVVGTAMWPAYAARATGLLFATAAVVFALGGLIEVNPVWLYGPFQIYDGTNGAQPDWYMGWLIGALRLMPPIEPTIGDVTLAGNPFFGGVLFPGAVFGFLFGWPWIERKLTGDKRAHHLLDRPRDNPWRTAVGAAVFAMIVVVFLAGAADRIFVQFGVPYSGQVWFFRVAFFVLPVLAYVFTKRVCTELRDGELTPIRTGAGKQVERNESGGFGAPAEK